MISLKQLQTFHSIEKIIIHSLDPCIYQASVEINGNEHIIETNRGELLKTRSLREMKNFFLDLPVTQAILRQESAYDEMINQAPRFGSNRMEIALNLHSEL